MRTRTPKLNEVQVKLRMQGRGIASVNELCKLSGISTGQMSHYMQGHNSPGLSAAMRIARVLGCRVEEIVS